LRLRIAPVFFDEITRRYFILNGFDGGLTVLGIILGSYAANVRNAVAILGAGLGASIAMGLSGLFAAYMTEKAESSRRLQKLERAMLSDLEDTVIAEASRRQILRAAAIDGISPVATTIFSLMPYALAVVGVVSLDAAFTAALAVNLLTLASLGAYLGRISGKSVFYYAGLTVVLGLIVALITILIVGLL
jgi:predicted membrane protein (TIGR00267 family)